MLEGVLSMQNLISDPVSMTSCRQEAYLLRLRRQFPFVYVKTLTRTAFGRSVYALQFGSGSRKLLITAGHHANETITSDAVWQWLFTFCNALLDGRTVCGAEARELYHNAMVYLVPLVNPDGADLAAGVCAPGSPEYRAAADIAAQYPDIPFPSGWKANLRGVDLNLNYPARWEAARRIKKAQGVSTPAPRDFAGFSPLDQPETAALAAFTRCIHPELMLALHTQGSVIYPGRTKRLRRALTRWRRRFRTPPATRSSLCRRNRPMRASRTGFCRYSSGPRSRSRPVLAKTRCPPRSCRRSRAPSARFLPPRCSGKISRKP